MARDIPTRILVRIFILLARLASRAPLRHGIDPSAASIAGRKRLRGEAARRRAARARASSARPSATRASMAMASRSSPSWGFANLCTCSSASARARAGIAADERGAGVVEERALGGERRGRWRLLLRARGRGGGTEHARPRKRRGARRREGRRRLGRRRRRRLIRHRWREHGEVLEARRHPDARIDPPAHEGTRGAANRKRRERHRQHPRARPATDQAWRRHRRIGAAATRRCRSGERCETRADPSERVRGRCPALALHVEERAQLHRQRLGSALAHRSPRLARRRFTAAAKSARASLSRE